MLHAVFLTTSGKVRNMAALALISIYAVATVLIALSGVLYLGVPGLPQFLQDLLLFGKARGKRKQWTWVRMLECPKRWFLYFYITGMVANGFILYTAVFAYILGQRPPSWLLNAISFIKSNDEVNTGAMSAILLVAMMFLQNVRRTLECVFVSVYSSGTMNVAHLSLGLYLYSTWGLVVLAEAPDMATYRIQDIHAELHNPLHVLGFLLFIVSSYNHNKVHQIFANLRKNKDGAVTSYHHRIPKGSWFKWVSCPHYLFEILIYVAFVVVSGLQHRTVWSVVIFVVVNQIISAFITHKWYKTEFKDYPKQRKAIIPFLL